MDSKFVHQQYCSKTRNEGGLQGLNFPLISDSDRSISYNYGVIISEGAETGASYRATFIIDKKQILRHVNINDLDANIDVMELLRIIKAYQFADENGTLINQKIQCPFSKTPDDQK
jgi:peroxiredoxin (alkyl hydroperoxide reductase subunit C)